MSVERMLREFFATRDVAAAAAYLVGSVARGNDSSHSDVDVAVLYAMAPPQTLTAGPLDLEEELERLLHRRVQVVALNTAPPDLVHRVLRDDIVLLDRDRSARIAFEVRLRNECFGLEPVRCAYISATRRPSFVSRAR